MLSDLRAFLYNLPYKPLILGLWWAGNCWAISKCEQRRRAGYGTADEQIDRFLEVRHSHGELDVITKSVAQSTMQAKYPYKSLFYQIESSLFDLAKIIDRDKLDQYDPRNIYHNKVARDGYALSSAVAILSATITPLLLLGCYCSPFPQRNGIGTFFYHLGTSFLVMPSAYWIEELQIQEDYPAVSPAIGFVAMAAACGLGEYVGFS